jgi:hypothetical protein
MNEVQMQAMSSCMSSPDAADRSAVVACCFKPNVGHEVEMDVLKELNQLLKKVMTRLQVSLRLSRFLVEVSRLQVQSV